MSAASTSEPLRGPLSWRALVWKAAMILIPLSVGIAFFFLRQREVARLAERPLRREGAIGPFQLVDQNGQPFSSDQLTGKIWIANFICIDCPGSWALVSSRMSETQKPLRETDVQFVSITLKPTPAPSDLLQKYAALLNASPLRWHFLTGEVDTIDQLASNRFKLHLPLAKKLDSQQAAHLFLIDRQGNIRGSYDATEADAVTRLLADTHHLIEEKPASLARRP